MEISKLISVSVYRIIYIIICIFLIFYMNRSNLGNFNKRVFIIGFSTYIINQSLFVIVLLLTNKSTTDAFIITDLLASIMVFSYKFGFLLILTGISFVNLKDTTSIKIQKIDLKGSQRSIGFSFFLFIITLGLYFPFWLHRTVSDLKRDFDSEVPYSPNTAVGFLFIPIFNVAWFIYIAFTLPKTISKIENKYFETNVGFLFRPELISILIMVIPLASYIYSYFEIGKFEDLTSTVYTELIFFSFASAYLWIIVQAKINTFFDFSSTQ